MNIRPYDVIIKKRKGKVHTVREIEYFIKNYTKGEIPDYQVSAWLMASFLNGLNEDETCFLTEAMLHSGKIIDLSSIKKPKVDKHSTGGVGDKISLILAPAVAACGVAVPMTSGRGLGFTGGTLDKLESIPGYNVHLSEKEFISVLKEVGFAMTGQTEFIAPADKKLYALRDVTGTVESIPLITSSILSKKFAEGADSVVMDVKFGSGAFMKTIEESRRLATSLVSTAERMGKKVICVLSNMNQPLGKAVGNSLEVIESIDCLRGNEQEDIIELVSVLGGYMLLAAGIVDTVEKGMQKIKSSVRNGEAFEKFKKSVELQGGSIESILDVQNLPCAHLSMEINARENGYITSINTENIGTAAVFLGAGRFTKEDSIDHASGIKIHKKIGDAVEAGEKLATLSYNDGKHLKRATDLVRECYSIGKEPPDDYRLIYEVIQ